MTESLIKQVADLLPQPKAVISFVGAGGKTTCLYGLARLLIDAGNKVLITTTTKMYHPEFENRTNWQLHLGSLQKPENLHPNENNKINIAAKAFNVEENKLIGFFPEELDEASFLRRYDYVLIEADGAKQKPIKAPTGHEPVIPQATAMVIGIVGLDCLGKPLNDITAHRAEILAGLADQPMGSIINKDIVYVLITSPLGLFKNAPVECSKVVILNKADTSDLRNQGMEIQRTVLQTENSLRISQILAGSLKP